MDLSRRERRDKQNPPLRKSSISQRSSGPVRALSFLTSPFKSLSGGPSISPFRRVVSRRGSVGKAAGFPLLGYESRPDSEGTPGTRGSSCFPDSSSRWIPRPPIGRMKARSPQVICRWFPKSLEGFPEEVFLRLGLLFSSFRSHRFLRGGGFSQRRTLSPSVSGGPPGRWPQAWPSCVEGNL